MQYSKYALRQLRFIAMEICHCSLEPMVMVTILFYYQIVTFFYLATKVIFGTEMHMCILVLAFYCVSILILYAY